MNRELSLSLAGAAVACALFASTDANAQPQPQPGAPPQPGVTQPQPGPAQPTAQPQPGPPPQPGAQPLPGPPTPPPAVPPLPPGHLPSETPPPPQPPQQQPMAPPPAPMFGPPGMAPWQSFGPPPPEEPRPGVSKHGLPLTMRGLLGIDGGFFSAGDEDASGATIDLVGGYPLLETTFLDIRVPLAFGPDDFAVGNVDVGAHHVLEATEGLWLSLGGGLGMPTLNEDTSSQGAYEIGTVTSAHWYFSEFWPNSVPIRASFGLEGHAGDLVTLRFFTNLLVMIGYEDNDEHELAIPHAFEVQLGHEFGGGLRVQGVALPTFEDTGQSTSFDRDLYQLALEPFFSYEGDVAFARAGIMMPLDGQLGGPFVQSWGFRLGTGIRLD